jgi:hypothetical protein
MHFDEGTMAIAGRIVRANSHCGSTVDALVWGPAGHRQRIEAQPNRRIVHTASKVSVRRVHKHRTDIYIDMEQLDIQ